MRDMLKGWYRWLRYEPDDPRFLSGGTIRIAVIGGGTGLSTMLRGLKKYSSNISAIVAVTDDGASSGEIRKEFDILPPGDIRKCISALSYDEGLVSSIFEYRFSKDKKGLGGHTLGNIWLTALSDYFGSFDKAVETTTELFQTAGRVLPATLENIHLGAEFEDGERVFGESEFVLAGKKIKSVMLDKKNVKPYKKAVEAIESADLIVIGPGSLYTSVIPNLLISGIRTAILKNKKAVKVYIANCSTERGETENYTVEDHLRALLTHSDKKIVNHILVNNKTLRQSIYSDKLGEVNNITTSKSKIGSVKVTLANIVSDKNPLYHDSDKLAKEIIGLYNSVKQRSK